MRLSERPTHWLPLNQLAFIFNKPLLIIRALLHTRHVLYMRRIKEGRKERGENVMNKNVWNERQMEICKRGGGWKRFWVRGRRGWDLSPVPPSLNQSISVSSSLSFHFHILPFIFLLRCSNFYGLGENKKRQRELSAKNKTHDGEEKCDWFQNKGTLP